MICKVKDGVSMMSVVVTVIVLIILATILIEGSSLSMDQAEENKIMQELTEVKKGVDTVRLTNAKTGKTDEDTINKGFIKVRVENPPESFVSFDEDRITGYVVDLSVIDYEKLESGRGYLTLSRDDIVNFDEDDVYIYDNAGKVFYAKGYYTSNSDEVTYTADGSDTKKDGPIIEVISTNNGKIKVKVTPIYGGEISSVMIGTKNATTADGTHFEAPVNKNGPHKVVATEEGGNTSVKIVDVGDIDDVAGALASIKNVYINDGGAYATEALATLHVEAENATHMSISQAGLIVPSATDFGKWRKYENQTSISLKEGKNQVYVWCKNADNVPTDYQMAEIILDSTPPTRKEPAYIINNFQIYMTCQQTDALDSDLKIEYGFRKESDSTFTWQNSPIVVDVDPGEKYVLITRATDDAGNSSESRTVLTEAIITIPSDIKMTSTPSEGWTTRVNVEIEYPNTYENELFENLYRIDGGEWIKVTSDKTQMTIIKNSKIEAAVSAKPNGQDMKLGEVKTLVISNIDRVDPYIHDVEDIGPYRQDGFDIKAKVYDKESGLVAWTVTTSKDVPTRWDNEFPATTDEIQMSFRVDVNDVYYFWVKDAGNNFGYQGLEVTNIDLYDPIIKSLEISYGTGEATLTAKAIDEELGINAYAFMKGQDAVPTESDWIPVEQTTTECTWPTVVSENDYYSIWVKDVSSRIVHVQKYVRVKYTVTYDYLTNKGESVSVAGGKKIVNCNSNVDLSPTATRSYSSFLGWHTSPTSKTAIESVRIGDPTTNQEDITIYAIFKWEDTISFSQKLPSEAFSLTWELNLTITKHIPHSKLQYSYDNQSWTNYSSALLITKNRTVYARTLIDGEVVKEAQTTISNICENHSFIAATCTTESRCRNCNKYNGPALNHSWGGYYTVYGASCTSNGLQRRTCNRGCGAYQDAVIPAYGHWYYCYASTSGANCSSSGANYYTCGNGCGAGYSVPNGSYGPHHVIRIGNMGYRCDICWKWTAQY